VKWQKPLKNCAETVARNYNITRGTLYNWKNKYSGMEASQVQKLKELEEENRRLKHIYAELTLDHKILKDIVEKSFRARG
jgi:putative transposase